MTSSKTVCPEGTLVHRVVLTMSEDHLGFFGETAFFLARSFRSCAHSGVVTPGSPLR